jgi:hypothetical protein
MKVSGKGGGGGGNNGSADFRPRHRRIRTDTTIREFPAVRGRRGVKIAGMITNITLLEWRFGAGRGLGIGDAIEFLGY